jgi:hypothetical protein
MTIPFPAPTVPAAGRGEVFGAETRQIDRAFRGILRA